MSNGSFSLSDALAKHGPWAILAGMLVYFLTQGVSGKLERIETVVVDSSTTLNQHESAAAVSRQAVQQQLDLLRQSIAVAKANCVNNAKDALAVARCQGQ